MLQKIGRGATGRYNAPAQLLHWLTALVIFTTIPLGWIIAHMGRDAPNHHVFIFFHKSFGMLALALIIARLIWRGLRKPPPLPDWTAKWEIGLAHATHVFLYLIFIVMPVSGYIASSANGHMVSFFGLPLPLLPEDKSLAKTANDIHLAGQYLVYFFLAAHLVGIVWHVAFRKDGYLARMLPDQVNGE
jgi:cytochrome b561